SLVVERQRQRIELRRGLFLDPRRYQLQAGERGARRGFAAEPLASDQPDGGREWNLLRIARADDRVAAAWRFGELGEIVPDAAHRAGAERLNAGHFQRVEHAPRLDVHWRDSSVQPWVMETEPERCGIGRATSFCDEPRLQTRAG